MLSSGDVVDIELGAPEGREAGLRRPAVVITAQRILDASPSVVQVVPLTRTLRPFHSEILVEPDPSNGLDAASTAQCQHVRSVAPSRIGRIRGNVGATVLAQVRETVAVILDLP
jgi:mRNA interferase MazF